MLALLYKNNKTSFGHIFLKCFVMLLIMHVTINDISALSDVIEHKMTQFL